MLQLGVKSAVMGHGPPGNALLVRADPPPGRHYLLRRCACRAGSNAHQTRPPASATLTELHWPKRQPTLQHRYATRTGKCGLPVGPDWDRTFTNSRSR